MINPSRLYGVLCLVLMLAWPALSSAAQTEPSVFYFSALNQRSPLLMAEYWNPILDYLSKKSGVILRLRIGKTAPETTALTVRGEAQFALSNHLFTSERIAMGWTVIAKPDTDGIRGQIVVMADSPIRRVEDLQGLSVAFPSAEAFVGYKVIMDALLQKGINVTPSFAGNQEGVVGQLKIGKVAAAGMNEAVLVAYGKRENFSYRVLWESQKYPDLAIMTNRHFVPPEIVAAVTRALTGMAEDAEGRDILERGAQLLKLDRAIGFVAASDKDYEGYRAFYRRTLLKE